MTDQLQSAPKWQLGEFPLDEIRTAWENHWFGIEGSPNHIAVGWLIAEVEWLQERSIFVEESFEEVRRDWRSACDDIDERDKSISTLREALEKIEPILGRALCGYCGYCHIIVNKALAATEGP